MSEPNKLPTLTGRQIASTQRALRHLLGLPSKRFFLPAVIGMLSDEIERLRAKGYDDTDVAELIQTTNGVNVMVENIGLHYAPPEARGKSSA